MSLVILFFLLLHNLAVSDGENGADFIFNGFKDANLSVNGIASTTSDGLLMVANKTKQQTGHAFYPSPLRFRQPPTNGTAAAAAVFSFSTTFVFGIISELEAVGGQGLAFLISPTKDFSTAYASQYLGLFNPANDGNSTNHVFAVELDIIQNKELNDIDNNHVGIDINSLKSIESHTAGYYAGTDDGSFRNLTLMSGRAMQVWVDYDGEAKRVDVTLAPVSMAKPLRPLLSAAVDLSSVFLDEMYVGFSAALGSFLTSHYVLGWSFKVNGTARALDYKSLPSLPREESGSKSNALVISLMVALAVLVVVMVAVAGFMVRRRWFKYAELLEDWEVEYGPQRFRYKDLFMATKGFKDKELLGKGGFGRVYRGVMLNSVAEVAVKRVSAESNQGVREFIAEVVTLGRLRHRNIVQLLGYCRRKGELLLVYDYMPNGSLDRLLYNPSRPALDWTARLRIIRGVAAGLLYLHEDWDQVVVHRDIKASNVLLDREMNARLGDFGLARLYDRETDPETTKIVGTMGYMAPELTRTGKATTATDVFAFGAFTLEVACGRRPYGAQQTLLEWVLENWQQGKILETRDPRLGAEECAAAEEEMEMVLKLGLLCSHPLPRERPSIRHVVQYLEKDLPLPEFSPRLPSFKVVSLLLGEGMDDYMVSYHSSAAATTTSSSVCGGR